MRIQINKRLLPMKAHYFLFNAGTAPVVPFMPTLAKQLGFSTVVTGTIYTVLPIVGMLAKPLFGLIGDRWQQHKFLLIIAQIITAIALYSVIFIPPISHNSNVEFTCHSGVDDIKYCPSKANMSQCVINNLETHYKNKLLSCDLHCNMNKEYWNIVCDNWGVYNNDNCPRNDSTIEMSIQLSVNHIEDFNTCLYFITHEAMINGTLTSKLYCPQNDTYFKTPCQLHCDDSYIQELISSTTMEHNDASKTYQFWMFFLLLIISWSGMAVVVSVADAICFELLGENHSLYGYQRLWGAVGWGVLSIISGYLVDKMSGGSTIKNYTIVFYMALIICFADAAVSTQINYQQTKLSRNIFKDVGKLFLVPRVVIFFLWCISVGLCTALVWNYLFWYLEDLSDKEDCNSKDYMKTLQGLVMGIQCFGGELPFFFLSKWIFRKIGYIHSMSLVLAAFGIRFILYYLLTNPWYVLPIEFMNGLTFGIFYSAMASYASIVAPPGTEATLQGLTGAIFEGVGVSMGSLIGGILFQVIGGRNTFLLFGSFSLIAFCVHVVVQWFMEKYQKQHGITSEYVCPNDLVHVMDEQEYRYSSM